MSLAEYEERLKKNVNQQMEGKAPVELIVDSFKDHWAFKDIEIKQTLIRELMFDGIFLVEREEMSEEIRDVDLQSD